MRYTLHPNGLLEPRDNYEAAAVDGSSISAAAATAANEVAKEKEEKAKAVAAAVEKAIDEANEWVGGDELVQLLVSRPVLRLTLLAAEGGWRGH